MTTTRDGEAYRDAVCAVRDASGGTRCEADRGDHLGQVSCSQDQDGGDQSVGVCTEYMAWEAGGELAGVAGWVLRLPPVVARVCGGRRVRRAG